MPSRNSNYSEEMREQTAQYILESGKSATGMAEELGIHLLYAEKFFAKTPKSQYSIFS